MGIGWNSAISVPPEKQRLIHKWMSPFTAKSQE
jgi:hypothetical protein